MKTKILADFQIYISVPLKKRLWHRCFPVNFVKFLRTPFFIKHLWWLLLLEALSVLQLLKFLSRLFDDAAKKLDNKAKVNFKVYDIATWETNNCNSHIAQNLKK